MLILVIVGAFFKKNGNYRASATQTVHTNRNVGGGRNGILALAARTFVDKVNLNSYCDFVVLFESAY